MAGWDDGIFGNLPRRYSQPATPGAQLPVLTDDGSAWPQTQPAAPQAGQGQGGGYLWPQILQGLWNSLKSGVTLPGDVATGGASMADPATQSRVGDMASVAMLGAGAAPAEPDALNMGIRAYHGSPHSFDRFDMSKIGTGEGAQAYGHGLYFAENENTAKAYRDSLTAGSKWLYGGKSESALDYLDKNVVDKHGMQGAIDSAVGRLKAQSDFYNKAYAGGDTAPNLYDNAVERLQRLDPAQIKPAGSMYQVDINADPEHFLDWDKPLSQQSPQVQQRLADVQRFQKVPLKNNVGEETTGGQMMGYLNDRFGNAVDATGELSGSGIPGIKYLDQGSRAYGTPVSVEQEAGGKWKVTSKDPSGIQTNMRFGTEQEARDFAAKTAQPTHNYVTFSDDVVNILKKYGLAGLGMTAGAGALTTQRPSPAEAGTTLGGGR